MRGGRRHRPKEVHSCAGCRGSGRSMGRGEARLGQKIIRGCGCRGRGGCVGLREKVAASAGSSTEEIVGWG